MAKYTVELREVIETFSREEVENWFKNWELSDYLSSDQIATIEEKGVFSKDILARNIVDSYYTREIGQETVGLFQHYAKLKMREIMGAYAEMIYTASIKIDPLVNENYTETFTRDAQNNGGSESSTDGTGFGIQSDTPQSGLQKEDLLAGTYASNATADTQQTSSNASVSQDEHETYTRTTRGNRGITSNAPYLIMQYRKMILNIYGQIIKECNPLFMQIY